MARHSEPVLMAARMALHRLDAEIPEVGARVDRLDDDGVAALIVGGGDGRGISVELALFIPGGEMPDRWAAAHATFDRDEAGMPTEIRSMRADAWIRSHDPGDPGRFAEVRKSWVL